MAWIYEYSMLHLLLLLFGICERASIVNGIHFNESKHTNERTLRAKYVLLTHSKIFYSFHAHLLPYILGIRTTEKLKMATIYTHCTHTEKANNSIKKFHISKSQRASNTDEWRNVDEQCGYVTTMVAATTTTKKNHFICISWKSKHVRCFSTAVSKTFFSTIFITLMLHSQCWSSPTFFVLFYFWFELQWASCYFQCYLHWIHIFI